MQSRQFITRSHAEPPFYVGFDLGGTNLKAGVVDNCGRPLSWHSEKTLVERGPEDGARRMAELVLTVIKQAGLTPQEIGRIGLGSPGTMDIPAGLLLEPPNLVGWENFPLVDRIRRHTGLDVTFANDAGAAAYGEFWMGSGRDLESLVMLTLGTGVGGGIIVHGRSIDGEHSHGAECGHLIIDSRDDARECSCGQLGHIEAYASALAVIKRTEEALAAGRPSTLNARVSAGEAITPLVVAQEAEKKDALALEIILETARYLGIGIVTLVHVIDPACVILGGAMTFGGNDTELGRRFIERVREEVRKRAFPIPAQRVKIEYAALGGDAGYIGAAGLARAEHQRLAV